ncbi:MAG TPA: response regulator transcription factor [Gemmatimonadaceae bacterium]|nr:response regulator transcription factor [Gemmatimonadaceae bacterium]
MAHILIVEDNVKLAQGLRANLEFDGHVVRVAHDGVAGLASATDGWPQLVILDLMLPGMDGYALLRAARERGVRVPVLILTALGEEAEKVRGFRFGADDYVTKPFGLMELLARVEALLRRTVAPPAGTLQPVYRFGNVEVHTSAHDVTRGGVPVMLRPREYDLLVALCARQGAVVSRADLLRDVWGYGSDVVTRTVDTHIAELRRKLETDGEAPRWILTVPRAGYRLAMPDDVPHGA